MDDDFCEIIYAQVHPSLHKPKTEEQDSIIENLGRMGLRDVSASLSITSLTEVNDDVKRENQALSTGHDDDAISLDESELDIKMDSADDKSLPTSDDDNIVVISSRDVRDEQTFRLKKSERVISKMVNKTISKQRSKEGDHPQLRSIHKKVSHRMHNLLGSNKITFAAISKLIPAIFTSRHSQTKLERLMEQSDKKFMNDIQDILLTFDWKKIDIKRLQEVVAVVQARSQKIQNHQSILKSTIESENSILPFSFASFCNSAQMKTVADGEVLSPLAVTWDGEDFLFAGQGKLFSCSEMGRNLKLLSKTDLLATALAVVSPKEAIAFLEGNAIKMFYKHDGKVEPYITGLRRPRGLAYIRGMLVTIEQYNGRCFISAFNFNKDRIAHFCYGTGSPSFVTTSTGRLYVTDLHSKAVTIVEARITSDNARASFKITKTVQLGRLNEDSACYPAGIASDSRGEVIISDARHGDESRVLWFDAQLAGWKRVEIPRGSYPYGSQIAISPKGYFLVACRQTHCMKMFTFVR